MASCAFSALALSQPVPLTPGTVVTGQCTGHTSAPGCVLPNLFGPEGITLAIVPGSFQHYAHFIGSAQQTLNVTLSTAIATQLTTLPIISPASGFTYQYDSSAGAFVRSTTSFGPVYSERAETIGRHKVSFGTSYQRFRFSTLDGINLRNLPAVFTHVPDTGTGGIAEPYEADVIKTQNSVGLDMDQTVLYGTVGLTDHLDFSVAVPIVSVRLDAASGATIEQISGPFFTLAGTSTTLPNPHSFAGGSLTANYGGGGSAAGIGDVTFRLKQSIFRGELIQVAGALDVRAPTGSAEKLLGSGAVGVKPFLIVSANRRFAPHLNLGYEWNGSSILAGNITGTTVSDQTINGSDTAVIQNGPATSGRLPSQITYAAGADWGATKSLTLSFDYLGQTLINTPRVFESPYTTADFSHVCNTFQGQSGCGLSPQTYSNIYGGKDTIGISNGAVGLKYNIFGRLLLTADLLFRMDNKGLRQDVTPLIALSYAVGK